MQKVDKEGKKETDTLIQSTFNFAVKSSSTSFHNFHVKDFFSKIWLYVGLFFSHFFEESIWREQRGSEQFYRACSQKMYFSFNYQTVMKESFISLNSIRLMGQRGCWLLCFVPVFCSWKRIQAINRKKWMWRPPCYKSSVFSPWICF